MKRIAVFLLSWAACTSAFCAEMVEILFTGQVDSVAAWDWQNSTQIPVEPQWYSVGEAFNYSLRFDPLALPAQGSISGQIHLNPWYGPYAQFGGYAEFRGLTCPTGNDCGTHGSVFTDIYLALTPEGTLDLDGTYATMRGNERYPFSRQFGNNGFSGDSSGPNHGENFSGHTLTATIIDPTGRFVAPAVPEPSREILLALGLGALFITYRRRTLVLNS